MPAKKNKNVKYYEAVGRRKEAVARVRLYIPGKEKSIVLNGNKISQGDIFVNNKPLNLFFASSTHQKKSVVPLALTSNEGRFAVSILVAGGGRVGQVEAISHGLARALVEIDTESHKKLLKTHGLLTRDPRTRERRKVGMGGKARRAKQSPKR